MTTPIGFKPVQLIDSDEWISRMKAAIGRKRKLNIFIDPGGSNHIVWNDSEKVKFQPSPKSQKRGN